jgi:hypothetical protein
VPARKTQPLGRASVGRAHTYSSLEDAICYICRREEGDCYVTFVFLQAGNVPRDLQRPQDWQSLNGKVSRHSRATSKSQSLLYIWCVQTAMPRQARTSQCRMADAGSMYEPLTSESDEAPMLIARAWTKARDKTSSRAEVSF